MMIDLYLEFSLSIPYLSILHQYCYDDLLYLPVVCRPVYDCTKHINKIYTIFTISHDKFIKPMGVVYCITTLLSQL